MSPREHPLVWSSQPPAPAPQAAEPQGLPPLGQRIKLRRETQGRGGKVVTALWDFQASESQLQTLGQALRRALGTGGSAKEGRVELQGDKVLAATDWLAKNGYKPVKAGG